jgi:DNA-binding MarR family transcriptional regulator
MTMAIDSAAERRRVLDPPYVLDDQVGFLLRQVNQRHTLLFAEKMGADMTPTQWAALAKLGEKGPCTQNLLGRLTAMDAATIKGVIDRLCKRGLTETNPDPEDGRRLVVELTAAGQALVDQASASALAVTEDSLAPLSAGEREIFLELLKKLR